MYCVMVCVWTYGGRCSEKIFRKGKMMIDFSWHQGGRSAELVHFQPYQNVFPFRDLTLDPSFFFNMLGSHPLSRRAKHEPFIQSFCRSEKDGIAGCCLC